MDAHPDGAALAADELPPGLDEPIERHAQYAVGNWEFHVITPEMASGYINDALWLTNPAEFPKVGVARHVVIGGQAAYPLVRMPVTWSWRIPISQRNIGGLDLDVFEPTLKIDPSLKYLPDLHESVLEVLSKCRINAIFTSPGYIRSQPALGPLIDGLVNQVITLWAIEDQLALDPESAIKRMRDVLMGHDVLLKPIVTRLIQEERRAIAFLENRAEDREDMRVQLHQLDQRLAQLLESTNPPPRPGAGLEEAGRARGDVLRAVPLLEPEAKAMIQGLFSPRAPSATPTKPQPVVALGPSVFAAFGPAERAKLTALVTHAVVAVPEDQAARVQLLVDLSFVHEATPLILWTYGAPDDGALALFEHGAQTFIPAVHRVTVASRTGFKQLLSQFVAHLTGAPPTPIQLHRLNEALAALA